MHFFCKLHPPRASFGYTMTPEEQQLMQEHAAYWYERVAAGTAVTFGFVADPVGGYGVGIVEFDGEPELHDFLDNDPTITAQLGFRFESHPMPMGAAHR